MKRQTSGCMRRETGRKMPRSGGIVACQPVADYSPAEQARVAEDVVALTKGIVIFASLADQAVLRARISRCLGSLIPGGDRPLFSR